MTLPTRAYREIPLTQGRVAFVSPQKYKMISQYSWHADVRPNGLCYAATSIRIDGKNVHVRMHRMIRPDIKGEIDHADGNGVNNCDYNLRPANRRQQFLNTRKRPRSTSPYKWVTFQKRLTKRPWQVRVVGKHLGYYATAEEAASVGDAYAKALDPEFARTNGIQVEVKPNHRHAVLTKWFEANPGPSHPEARILKYTLACGHTHQISACQSPKIGKESYCKTCGGSRCTQS